MNKIIVLFVVFATASSCNRGLPSLRTVSPGATYEVRLTQYDPMDTKISSTYPYFIKQTLFRNGKLIFSVPDFEKLDYSEARYSDRYKFVSWPRENILRLSRSNAKYVGNDDNVIIRNESSRDITQMVFENNTEKFFVFDISPGQEFEISCSPQRYSNNETNSLWAKCFSEDGNVFVAGGTEFQLNEISGQNSRNQYCVIVQDNDVRIRSFDYHGRDFSDPDHPRWIDKVSSCGPTKKLSQTRNNKSHIIHDR